MSTIEIPFAPHCALQAEALEGGIVRIRASGLDGPSETLLERYRFLKPLAPAAGCQAAGDRLMLADGSALRLDKHGGFQLVDAAGTTIVATTTGTKPGTAATATGNAGWQLSLPMAESEKIIGGGDHRRDRLLLNGERSQLWVRYQLSHVPVPLFLSSRGYGLFFNTTRRVLYDIGATTPGVQTYKVAKDYLDVYIIRGASYDEIIASYCSLTGLPPLPSERSFGGWLLANEFSNGQEVVALARNLRTARIPMDHIGLEPYWMDTRYDFSADKQWSKTRFLHWGDKGGPVSMIKTLARQGFTLGLWLCSKWDLTWEEERRIGADTQSGDEIFDMSDIEMTHFDDNVGHKPIRMDDLTKRDEPWFEHLKTFIDHGVRFFKLDPAVLINEFPDRLYGNGRTEDEVHNLQFVMAMRQMSEGYREHTGQRPQMLYLSGWAGFQCYAGTWAGDTGGGKQSMCGILQDAVVGHAYATFDMNVDDLAGIHIGYLTPWCLINSWAGYDYPQDQGPVADIIRAYAELRYRLLPFLYSCADRAHTTGMAIARPLLLSWPEVDAAYQLTQEYLLGDSFLVTVYDTALVLPAGRWYDVWTAKVHTGDWSACSHAHPDNRGGHLLLRENRLVPLGPVQQWVGEVSTDQLDWWLLPAAGETSFALYRDGGEGFAHETGAFARATLTAVTSASEIRVSWSELSGDQPERIASLRHRLVLMGTRVSTAQAGERALSVTWDETLKASVIADFTTQETLSIALEG